MRFAPHTSDDERRLLDHLGLETLDDLYADVPKELLLDGDTSSGAGLAEPDLLDTMRRLAAANLSLDDAVCFLGGGVYDHFVPAFVGWVVSRPELATSYTPYQAELSQGSLQALFEFQTVVSEVLGLPLANSSLYDGATALVEAVHLAVTATRQRRVVLAGTVDPRLREVLDTYAPGLSLELVTSPVRGDGTCDVDAVTTLATDAAAVVVQHPNVVGALEAIPALADAAHSAGARLVVHFDAMLAGVLSPPGRLGADVVVADGLSVGNQPSFGGPGVGLMAVAERDVRLLPGRLVGLTVDADDRPAYVLTMQAREQHIRRERATSNICTNQALNAVATTAYLSWLGPDGLLEVGERCLAGVRAAAEALAEALAGDPEAGLAFAGTPVGKELALRLPRPHRVLAALAERGVLAGPVVNVAGEDLVLVAVTEQRTREDIDRLAQAVVDALAAARAEVAGETQS